MVGSFMDHPFTSMPETPGRVPPLQLLDFVEDHVGAAKVVADLSWDHAESAVWKVCGEYGDYILKAHRQVRKFRQELNAYQRWLPLLKGTTPMPVNLPRLVASRQEAPHALLFSFEPGVLLESPEGRLLAEGDRLDVFRRAGVFLRLLHDLPMEDDDPVPLAQAFAMRAESWSKRAEEIVPEGVRTWVALQLQETLPLLRNRKRVPTHRDFTPRNWLLAPDTGMLTVIDFEHSRLDLLVGDFERVWAGYWPRDPAGREAFLTGYGRVLSGEEEELLAGISALGGLTTVVWAREHDDRRFEREGWQLLARLGCPGL